jgi:glucose/arabinose dehydrogenase
MLKWAISVVFLPFENGRPTGEIEDFATGFAGKEEVKAPNEAQFRPTGLAQGADGSLFVSDSEKEESGESIIIDKNCHVWMPQIDHCQPVMTIVVMR